MKDFNKINEHISDNTKNKDTYLRKASILLESLPYIKQYSNRVVVIKIGGSMMEDDRIVESVLDDMVLMKFVGIKVVLVHGGGRQITEIMKEKGIKAEFVDGLRITSREVIDIVKMVLIGSINSRLVSYLNRHGDIAIGISGNDANFIKCIKKQYSKNEKQIDLGFVGEIKSINRKFIDDILYNSYIPVVATLGVDKSGDLYNINADSCASEIAIALNAEKMIILTDVDGIIDEENGNKKLISKLGAKECLELIESGKISSGMIPKVKACIKALSLKVNRTHILNGTIEHSILVEVFTDRGIGTMITGNEV
jgi:acetylglutamate kinase